MKNNREWRLESDRGVRETVSAASIQSESYQGRSSFPLAGFAGSTLADHLLVVQTDFVLCSVSSSEANWLPLRTAERRPSRELSRPTTCSSVRSSPKRSFCNGRTSCSRSCGRRDLSVSVRRKSRLLRLSLRRMCGPF